MNLKNQSNLRLLITYLLIVAGILIFAGVLVALLKVAVWLGVAFAVAMLVGSYLAARNTRL